MNRPLMTTPCIELHEIHKTYQTAKGPVHALQDITLSVAEGEFVSIVGQTGCGKSTLLKIISGILKPSKGQISVRGKSVREAQVEHEFGFIFQDPVLLPWRDVLKNIRLPLEVIGYPEKDLERHCLEMLDFVGLRDFAAAKPWELSGGMRQRVAIVRALGFDPSTLLMDEPFSALDEITRQNLHEDFLRLWEKGRKTVVFVTHSVAEAVFLSDRVVVMSPRPGRIRKEVDVQLPRPRMPEMTESRPYFDLLAEVRSHLVGELT